jgi:hypothetical protein
MKNLRRNIFVRFLNSTVKRTCEGTTDFRHVYSQAGGSASSTYSNADTARCDRQPWNVTPSES